MEPVLILGDEQRLARAAASEIDDALTGDAVCAVVTRRAGAELTGDALAAWCGGHLAGYKVPTCWYVVDDPLPRNAAGKLPKHALRAAVDAGSGVGAR